MIDLTLKRIRKEPMINMEIWNKHELVMSGDFKMTNNSLEKFNGTWNPLIPKNTTVWNLILQFKNEENAAKLTHVQAMRGNLDDIHVQRKEKTKKKHSRLHSLCSNYSEMSSMDFLECIANVLHS